MVSAFAADPAADAILLVLMFVGLLRRAHGCKVGIWNVLYKQVNPCSFYHPSLQVLNISSVHHLDNRCGHCRDTAVGPWAFQLC
jgi:hypothetical protein